jgi:hypothetical protein
MAENEERTPTAFERFVQRIAAVPKAKVDALEAADREQRRKSGPETQGQPQPNPKPAS